jgi:CDP-diacylglycerol--glycerol-3-phosphate 3-phosphatidyltransferase
MSLANKLTFFRLLLSPLFFISYLLLDFSSLSALWVISALWLIFIVSEITDLLDGIAARKRNEVSDFGKLFDPFADTIMQITCFLCFVIEGIFPAILFLLIIYREFGILIIRNLMLRKGITLAARMGGKIKTVTYIIAGSAALLTVSFKHLFLFESMLPFFEKAALVIFTVSVFISLLSFFDYLLVYRKARKNEL